MGALVLGWLIDRVNRRLVLGMAFTALGAALVALALLQGDLPAAIASGFAVGMFVNGSTFLLYGLAPAYYNRRSRGTGVGWAVAVGRLGSILGPTLAGVLLGAGFTPEQVLLRILPVVLVTALSVQALQFCRPAHDG